MASTVCKTINFLLLIPTILFVAGCVFSVYQAKRQVEVVQQSIPKEIVLPSLEELRSYASGTHDLLESRFSAWATAYNKKYPSESEKKKRLGLYAASARMVQEHNSKIPANSDKYRLGLNEYADMSDAEFFQHFGLGTMKGQEDCSATHGGTMKLKGETPRPADLPLSIDWREKGVVSPVKNQGHCGSCWTFSTTGALEAHYKKKFNRWVNLSEQQLLDCAGNYDNHGCNGGLPSHAFQYIHENGGLDTERAYPYEMKSEGTKCRMRKWGVGVQVKGVHNITQFDETELEVAVGTVGPVSIAFQVANDFRLYAGGVYDSTVCQNQPKDVNHAVLAVGYGVSPDGTKYWIIKNSWGESWGVKGFFNMKRGVNMCGVSDCASYPIL
jgi:cathepsin H